MRLTEKELAIEEKMHAAFWQQAEALPGLDKKASAKPKVTKAGGEIELFLFDQDGRLATHDQKSQITKQTGTGAELGACVIEIHPDPISLPNDGFCGWIDQLHQAEDEVVESAASIGLFVGRSGTIPWVRLSDVRKTPEEKYEQVPAFHDKHRSPLSPMQIGPIALKGASEVGGINSFQFSIQAQDAPDSVDKLNRLFAISPWVSALSSNARIINGKDTNRADNRFEIWKQTHDLRSEKDLAEGKTVRVGLPKNYPQTLREYLEEVSSHPFILDKKAHALDVGIGLSWRDARIKVINGNYVVEFRPISIQPTLMEDMALAAFTIGRQLWSQQCNEQLPQIGQVRQNKAAAEQFGINAVFIDSSGSAQPVRKLLENEIIKARSGLTQAEILDHTAEAGLQILLDRVRSGITPDQRLVGLNSTQLINAVKIL